MTHQISLATAIDMTTRYRNNHPADYPLSETFQLSSILRLLATPNAAFLRIYYGLQSDGKMDAILVVADSDNNDILPESNSVITTSNDDPVILEDAFRCPPTCSPESPLNS